MKITTNAFIFHNEKVLFIYHKNKNKWMHPGGHLEEGEDFDESLKREIKEETNLRVEIIGNKQNIGLPENFKELSEPFFIHKSEDGKIAIDYICKVKEPINIDLQKEEVTDYKWLSKKEIKNIDTYPALKKLTLNAFEKLEEFE